MAKEVTAAAHGAAQEIAFLQSLSARNGLTRLHMLRSYRAAAEKRTDWGVMDAEAVIAACEALIEAEAEKTKKRKTVTA